MSDLKLALAKIQQSLNAPKSQYNKFGDFHYRNIEDIMEGLKPVLGECVVTVSDDIVAVGSWVYVKATATISLGTESMSVTGFAREEESKKKYSPSQLTGSASSYARKYALGGLFLIDDNKDDDSNDKPNTTQQTTNQGAVKLTANDQTWINTVRKDQSALNQITDLDYRQFIFNNL